MTIYVAALLIGIVAGLRAMTAPAAVSWGAYLGWMPVSAIPGRAFMGHRFTPWIFTCSRSSSWSPTSCPRRRAARCRCSSVRASSAAPSAAPRSARQAASSIGGLIAGVVGAVIGTLGGYEARRRLVAATGGKDLPIALLEDAVGDCPRPR